MRKTLRANNRGLTLVELLVGVAILAVIVVPLLHTFITGANTVKKSKEHSDATLAAQNIIEDIKATDMSAYLSGIEAISDEESPDKRKYIKEIETESGGTSFEAKVTINPLDSVLVPFSNQMDAVFQMQAEDLTALAVYNSSENLGKLQRYITIEAREIPDNPSAYKLNVKFDYEGNTLERYEDLDGNEYTRAVPFDYSLESTINVSQRSDIVGEDAFAAFLFFTAFPLSDNDFSMGRTEIHNHTSRDFNVFLVDAGVDPNSIKGDVAYYCHDDSNPQVDLMTNMHKVTYKLYKSSGSSWYTPVELPVTLVETDAVSHVYDIRVEIKKAGSDKLLADMSATKLDYTNRS